MIYLLFGTNMAMIAAIFMMAASRQYGKFAGSALNPLNLFAVYSILYSLNFVAFWMQPEINMYEQRMLFLESEVEYAYAVYTAFFFMILLGFIVGHLSVARRPPSRRAALARPLRQASGAVLVFALIGCLPAVATIIGSASQLSEIAPQVFARDNQYIVISVSLLIPSLAAYLSVRRLWSLQVFMVCIAVTIILLATGVRGLVLFAVVTVGVNVIESGLRVSVLWDALAIPMVAVFLAVSRYYFREGQYYNTFTDFIAGYGGYLQLYFGSEEIAFAQIYSTILLRPEHFDWSPFNSLLGIITFPFPRAIFAFKPLGASAYFTEQISPFRWEYTKSELTITGYGDLVMSFGAAFTGMLLPFLSFLWMRARGIAMAARTPWGVIWLPCLIWLSVMFLRADLFNMSSITWPYVVVVALLWMLSRFVFKIPNGKRHVDPPLNRRSIPVALE
jgi:hypothetical protein